MNIIILGGTGFVGTSLVSRWTRAGHDLVLPTRNPSLARHLAVLPTVRLVRADVHDPATLARLFKDCDVVVNLVGILNERGDSGRGFLQAHTELTRKTGAAAAAAGVARYLHMSALGADEHGPSHYLRSKGLAERIVQSAPPTLDWTIFRPSVIFGTRDSLTNRFAALLRLSRGFMPLARAQARFAPVWVEDVASAFDLALAGSDATSRKTFELCGPEVMTLGELVTVIGECSGTPASVLPLPDVIGRAQAFVMDFLPGKPFSRDNFRSLTVDNVCRDDGFKALGIRPAALRGTMRAWRST
ncbi:MAG: complex I NDUFA9 subunit family protein [Steroidobacteraceae bacterium]